jgi:hypothetical protein
MNLGVHAGSNLNFRYAYSFLRGFWGKKNLFFIQNSDLEDK